MNYKNLNKTSGWRCLSKVLTIVLSQKQELFVEPFSLRELRYRCFFIRSENKIYLYLTNEEISQRKELNPLPRKIYLYGAYNQFTVCQIRALSIIKEVSDKNKISEVILLMEGRLNGKRVACDNFSHNLKVGLDEKNRKQYLDALSSDGKLYVFEPLSYAYNTYERG